MEEAIRERGMGATQLMRVGGWVGGGGLLLLDFHSEM